MIKIAEMERLGEISVLFLDGDTPATDWNKVVIGGVKYDPVPVYDIKQVVAVVGNNFFSGQEVEFLYER